MDRHGEKRNFRGERRNTESVYIKNESNFFDLRLSEVWIELPMGDGYTLGGDESDLTWGVENLKGVYSIVGFGEMGCCCLGDGWIGVAVMCRGEDVPSI